MTRAISVKECTCRPYGDQCPWCEALESAERENDEEGR